MTIDSGSVSAIAQELQATHHIRSAWLFKALIVLMGRQREVLTGDYFFTEPQNLFSLVMRMTHGQFGVAGVRLTIPEGSSRKDIATIASKLFKNFDSIEFLSATKNEEGYLFPDTYHFLPNTGTQDVLTALRINFKKKAADLSVAVAQSSHSLSDVITMASLVEKEGRTTETRRIIAGILWKRISLGMPLQVDSSFLYINGKTTSQLTLADLALKSPYNTYTQKGLPPTPIDNPGLDSINATLDPISTPYLYFLSDKNGVMHYATTLAEHNRNKDLYLR